MSDTKPLVAVTGATGFTGGALVRALLAEDYRVRALVRDGRRLTTDHPGLERITGDLADRQALAALVRGAELVMHVAAKFRTEGPLERFASVNHQGTVNMLEAARSAGVRRFVHCSTIGVHGDVHRGPADEESPFNPRDNYQRTKVMAEDACREEMARGNMEIVIARPCAIYGPGDLRMLKMFRLLSHRSFVMIGDGKPNFHPVYIDDLVDGFLATMRVPEAAGEAFILGGPRYLPLADYVATAAAALGVPPPRFRLPYRVMNGAAWACEAVCRPVGIEPPLHRRRLTFFRHNRAFSIEKARRILGYSPRIDLEEGFRRTVAQYRRDGQLAG